MTRKLRAVLDTNVLISAALPPTPKIYVVRRPCDDRDDYIEWLDTHTYPVEVEEQVQACRDPDGDKFLELALSGDDDLQVLHPFRGIPILSPAAFLKSDFVDM